MSFVSFGGSRVLTRAFFPLVSRVVAACLLRGFSVRVGCARGADAAVVSAVLAASAAPRLSVFCAGSPRAGALAASAAGARVVAWAGGCSSLPAVARLAIRSRRCVAGSSVAVFFLASANSAGSLGAAAAAVAAGARVFAFSCGFETAPVSLRGCSGAWQPSCLAGCPCFVWQPAAVQPALF